MEMKKKNIYSGLTVIIISDVISGSSTCPTSEERLF